MIKLLKISALVGLLHLTTLAQAAPSYADGDLAPLGAPDGLLTLSDYLIAGRLVASQLTPTALDISHGDIYPTAAPDGVIDIHDLFLLQQWLLDGNNYYVEILDLFNDGPATITLESGGAVSTTTIVAGGFTGPGASVVSDPNFTDPDDGSNTVWRVAIGGGVANVFLSTANLSGDPVFNTGFDLSGDGLGQLVFDFKLNSISSGTVITAKIDSGYPALGQVVLDTAGLATGVWHRMAINFADLLADPGPGDGLDLNNVLNAFVLEVSNGSADFYLDNIFIKNSCPQAGGCQASINTKAVYTLVWSDEFDGDSLSAENWSIETGYGNNGWGNDEWQLYRTSSDNISVADGNLTISAQCSTAPQFCGKRNGTITSGKINSLNKFEFKYGKVQARIRPPVGTGSWPAFWMLGANFPEVGWPRTGEIDIMEMSSELYGERTTLFTLHWCDDYRSSNPCQYDPGWRFETQTLTFAESLGDDFHIFEAEWTEQGIVGKIDGITYYNRPFDAVSMSEFLEEFYMILNVAIGGTLGGRPDATTVWPQTMVVDYVRVYQDDGGNGTFTVGDPPAPTSETLGVYSETHTQPVSNFINIINGADFGGNNTPSNTQSTAVVPFDGSTVMAVDYINTGRSYGGIIFDFSAGRDISAYQTLKFAIDSSAIGDFADLVIQIENPFGGQPAPRVLLSAYTPVINNNWAEYEIPLSDFLGQVVGLDLSNVVYLGFWNAQGSNGQLTFGTLYFDDIHFAGGQ